MVKRSVVWTTLALVVTAAAAALPAQAPPKPDSPEVVRLLETAKADAGAGWSEAYDFICAPNPRSRTTRCMTASWASWNG